MQPRTDQIKDATDHTTEIIEENQNVGVIERIISGIAAVAVGAYAIKKKDSLIGKGLTVLSGFLLKRARTVFCPLDKAIGRNSLMTN